jgi:hypothetical protein
MMMVTIIIIMEYECVWGMVRGSLCEGRGRKGYSGVKRINVCYIYVYG